MWVKGFWSKKLFALSLWSTYLSAGWLLLEVLHEWKKNFWSFFWCVVVGWVLTSVIDWGGGADLNECILPDDTASWYARGWCNLSRSYLFWSCDYNVQWVCRALNDNFPSPCVLQATRFALLSSMGLCSAKPGAEYSIFYSWSWHVLSYHLLWHWLCPRSKQVTMVSPSSYAMIMFCK